MSDQNFPVSREEDLTFVVKMREVIYLPGLQWHEKLAAELIYDSVRTELAAHIMLKRMLCSCEDHGLLFRATDEDDSDELEAKVEVIYQIPLQIKRIAME